MTFNITYRLDFKTLYHLTPRWRFMLSSTVTRYNLLCRPDGETCPSSDPPCNFYSTPRSQYNHLRCSLPLPLLHHIHLLRSIPRYLIQEAIPSELLTERMRHLCISWLSSKNKSSLKMRSYVCVSLDQCLAWYMHKLGTCYRCDKEML